MLDFNKTWINKMTYAQRKTNERNTHKIIVSNEINGILKQKMNTLTLAKQPFA